jgi:hypothetical protein
MPDDQPGWVPSFGLLVTFVLGLVAVELYPLVALLFLPAPDEGDPPIRHRSTCRR